MQWMQGWRAGLSRIELGWAGLGSAQLDCTALYCAVLRCAVLRVSSSTYSIQEIQLSMTIQGIGLSRQSLAIPSAQHIRDDLDMIWMRVLMISGQATGKAAHQTKSNNR